MRERDRDVHICILISLGGKIKLVVTVWEIRA